MVVIVIAWLHKHTVSLFLTWSSELILLKSCKVKWKEFLRHRWQLQFQIYVTDFSLAFDCRCQCLFLCSWDCVRWPTCLLRAWRQVEFSGSLTWRYPIRSTLCLWWPWSPLCLPLRLAHKLELGLWWIWKK